MPGMNKPAATRRCLVSSVLLAIVLLPGCDLLTVSQTGRNIREGNAAVVRGEYQRGVQYYESALDGTMLSAEAHYRLGLVYEDHLKNQVAALHHFERYLELAPQGQFATDVKGYVERLRLVIVSSLADGTVLPAKEASRLKNENLELRQQVAELRQRQSPSRSAPAPTPAPAPPTPTPAMTVAATPPPLPVDATPQPEVRRAEPVAEPEVRAAVPVAVAVSPGAAPVAVAMPAVPAGPRTHTVVSGDTLAGISRKYYRKASEWQKIAQANKDILPDPAKLQVGMVLKIPAE